MGSSGPSGQVLSRFWDLSRDLLAVADLDGYFLHLNDRWGQVTGYSEQELCARPFIEFVHPDDRERTASEAAEMAATGRDSVSFENRFVAADGSSIWLLWNSYTSVSEGRIYAVATDVTRRRRSERRLRTMQRIAAASNEADALDDALGRALAEMCELTGWPAGHAYVREPMVDGDGSLVPTGIWQLAEPGCFEALREATVDTTFRKGEGLPGLVWASGEAQWFGDVGEEPWWRRGSPADLGIHGAVAFPVRSRDAVIAVLEFFAAEPAALDDELLDLMDHVGTQVGRVHDRLEAVEAQQAAIETERRFLSMLSHEVRSPLMSIKGFVDLMLDRWEELDEGKRREFLDRVNNSADRLHRLVEEFLSLAKHHQEGFQPRFANVQVAMLVRSVCDDLGDVVTGVEVDVADDLVASADVDFTTQILTNLLTNTQRHGNGPVRVSARMNDGRIHLSVRDHGAGISDDFLPHLFKRFARADRDSRGTGLGLSISRELAEAQDGSLTYETADPGARFVLTLPPAGR